MPTKTSTAGSVGPVQCHRLGGRLRKIRLGWILVVTALGLLGFPAAGEGMEGTEVWGIHVMKYGPYQAETKLKEAMPETPGGQRRLVTGTEFLEETFRIPARMGVRFGFTYTVSGTPKGTPVAIRIRKKYPGLKDPNKPDVMYAHSYVKTHEIGSLYGTGYGFDHPWELVPGRWAFQFFYDDKPLGEIVFEVYMPQ